ncbi:MAG: ABC transporter permease [Jatrophihabitans sp.]|nr:MAG: ABC transporter permease [Jatrophihabitans sp.]
MTIFFTYTVLGLVLGAVYGIAASGLVLTYNTSGVFNFAHGAEAMLGAFVYWQLRFGWHWPAPVALVVTLGLVAPLMGALLYLLVIRGLRNTAEVTKIVVTVAIMLGMVALSQWLWNPNQPHTVDQFFGYASSFKVFGVSITTHEVITLVIAVLIAVGMRLLFHRTRVGVAMRAVVDDPDLLQLNGHNPQRLSLISWVLGAGLAVLAGVLVSPISGGTLDANVLTLLVIDAFAAAMFGRLRSIPRTFVGSIVLGLAATYVLAYFPSTWSWTSNFRISLPMIVLFAVLIILPQDRLQAAATRTRERYRVPSVRKALAGGVALVVVVFLLRLLMVDADIIVLALGMCFALMALSLTLLTGYAGQMNLAVCSFAAIATLVAYHAGVSGTGVGARITEWGVLLAVAVTAVIGAIVALPALRMRGLYLALGTMAFGVFVSDMVLADISPHVLPLLHIKFSLFTQGTLIIPAMRIGPLDLSDHTTFLMSVTVVFALLGIGLVALRNSSYGRRIAALKDSPVAAAMLGQNLVRLKLSVFMLSAAIAGLGGIFMAASVGAVTADNFSIFLSLALVMLTVSAGIGYVTGALLGGIMAGVGFSIVISSFNNLAHGGGGLSGLWSTLAHVSALLPALVGVTIGQSPSGFLHELFLGYRRMAQHARGLLIGAGVADAVLYVLALTKVVDNWWFGFLTYAGIVLLPAIAQGLRPALMTDPPPAPKPDWEAVGVDQPYTDQVRAALDTALALPATPRRTVPVAADPGPAAAPAVAHAVTT